MRKKRLIKKSVFCSLIFLVFLAGLVGFFYIPYFKIKKVSIEGNTTIATESLMAEVLNYLRAKQFKILPRNNILIFSKKDLSGDILKKFGRIENIVIDKTIAGAISVKVNERNNEAVFCPEERKCFFLDENGFVFEPAPNFSAGVYLTFFKEEESSTPVWESNSQMISQEQFKNLIDFKNLIKDENIKITDIILKKEGIYQLNTAENWHVLLNEQNNSQDAYQNLKIALGQIGDKRKNLSYIDLRFGNKVFYKFK